MSHLQSNCAGMPRRDFVQLGLGAVMGMGFGDLLRVRAQAAQTAGQVGANPVNCILIWMDGGPTHYETFDPKPEAPSEIRGDFKPIRTKVPGTYFAEVVPKLAGIADKLTIVRSICHRDPNHGGGNHYMMTGAPTPVPVGCGAFVTFHPAIGSVVSYERGLRHGLPAYMTLPSMTRSGGPNFLGAQHAPFVIGGDPNGAGFKVRDVVLPTALSEGRAMTRQQLRKSLDRMQRITEAVAEDPAIGFDSFYQQGVDLISSPEAQAAFDIQREPEKVRELYGRNDFGQRLLLCRRLVEVGVSFVTCNYGGWDHHSNLFKTLKGPYMQNFDQGIAALITDLEQRGLLANTLVIALGEFGRTPTVNKDGGRDHWPHAMSVLMAGGGIPGGQVVGATDVHGAYASSQIHSPEDFAYSLYTKMGIDPAQHLHTNTGRPVQLVNGGQPIKELFA